MARRAAGTPPPTRGATTRYRCCCRAWKRAAQRIPRAILRSMKFSVLIVDDEPLARQGVALRLRSHDDLHVIGECSIGQEALDAIRQHKPDLMFLDIQMPLLNCIEVLRTLAPEQTPY